SELLLTGRGRGPLRLEAILAHLDFAQTSRVPIRKEQMALLPWPLTDATGQAITAYSPRPLRRGTTVPARPCCVLHRERVERWWPAL
ncbi:unnamed protein product, partial [Polarella glacialis]